jgi:hypothetical protein
MQVYFSLTHTIKIAKSDNYLKNEYTQTALNSTPVSMKFQILKITPFQSRRNHGLQVRTDWGITDLWIGVSHRAWILCHEPVIVLDADFIQNIVNYRCL